MNTNILIISYFFPPCNKVGGRRWAKFGKYLTEKGYNVFVVCVDVPYNGICPWEKDTNEYAEHIFRLRYIEHRPYYRVNKSPITLKGKVNYRLSLYKRKIFPERTIGDSADASRKYGKILFHKASEVISNEKISTVIITGGPFHWCYESIQLKHKFKSVNFLIDFRDFWTGGENYSQLNEQDRIVEDKKEMECITLASHIFSPAERITDFLKKKYVEHTHKIHTLPHAYDKSELPINLNRQKEVSETLTFAYGGMLYSKMEDSIKRIIEFLNTLISLGHKVALDIYTFDQSYQELFISSGLNNVVTYHAPVPPMQLFDILLSKDYVLQLRAGQSQEQHFKSTKFYELIALRQPIIYFGPEGDVSEFIQVNKLGFSGNTEIKQLCDSVISNKQSNTIPYKSFDISMYEYKHVTEILENYL